MDETSSIYFGIIREFLLGQLILGSSYTNEVITRYFATVISRPPTSNCVNKM